jgi:hypothetical protein
VNSYLQQDLVGIIGSAREMLAAESGGGTTALAAVASGRRPSAFTDEDEPARALFERLLLFEARLETSLQRGPVLFGYSKQRLLKHDNVVAVLFYAYNLAYWWLSCQYCYSPPRSVRKAKLAAHSWMKPVGIDSIA